MREAPDGHAFKTLNIIPVHDVDSYKGRYYMVADFVEGQ